MTKKSFGLRLAKLRIPTRISARELSLSMNKAENYISSIETGKSFPSLKIFFEICECIDITPRQFFDEENNNPTLVQELAEELKHLDDESLTLLLGIARNMQKK